MGLAILEIIKIIFPAIIVAIVTYFVLREMLRKQLQMQHQKLQQDRQSSSLPLRYTAYERLSLFCERITLPALLMRVRSEEMNATSLKIGLMMAVQQEYEHNVTQQIYVSDQLWQIIKVAREDVLQFIDIVADKVDKNAPGGELATALLGMWEQRESDPLLTAQSAVRKEAATIF